MQKLLQKISIILIVAIFTNLMPSKIFAKEDNSSDVSQETDLEEKNTEEKIVEEDVSKREGNVKHFLKEDNSYEAVVYPIQVHYMENGQWQDIDNTLEEAKDESFKDDVTLENGNAEEKENLTKESLEEENVLKNKKNDFDITFAKNSKSNKLVTIKKDKYELSWGMDNVKEAVTEVSDLDEEKVEEKIQDEVNEKVENNEEYSDLSSEEKEDVKDVLLQNEKVKVADKAVSTVAFKDIYKGIDLTYDLMGDVVKENFVINEPQENITMKVKLNLSNLVPVIQEDKSIVFYDSQDSSKEVYRIAAPVMIDDNGESSTDIKITLDKDESGYKLNIVPDEEWLDDSDRAYPVKLDPTVETSSVRNDIQDTFVCSIDTEKKNNSILMHVGNITNVGAMRAYLKFKLPTLNLGDTVIGARLNLYQNSADNGGAQINVHKVLNDWNINTINWANKPNYNGKIEEYENITSNIKAWHYFDITGIAKEWYESGNNYGLMLKAENESKGQVVFRSADTTDTNARPSVDIRYVSNVGVENAWTYHTQDLGRAGTAYVNDYNGSLTVVHNALDMTGNRIPINIDNVYTIQNAAIGCDWGYGVGWRLNLQQTIQEVNYADGLNYVYTDEDGTVHYFKGNASSTIKDQDGLDLKLTKNSDGTYVIEDKENNKSIFSSDGYLKELKDSNDNVMEITLKDTPRSKVVDSVKDGAGRVVKLNYDSEQRLSSITEPDGSTAATYTYSGGLLTKITYKDGQASTYNYCDGNKINEIINCDGYKVSYGYAANSKKINLITEGNTDGTLGGSIGISYANNTTEFSDNVEYKKAVYTFNNRGNTISVKDDDGNAKYYKYDDITNINKVTVESKVQKTVLNLAQNGSMEENRAFGISENGGSVGYQDGGYLGNRSIKITRNDSSYESYAEQYASLEKGKKYTFSAYLKTNGVTNDNDGNRGARLVAFVQDKDGNYIPFGSEFIQGDNDWERYETTFTIPEDSVSNTVIIRAVLEWEAGTVYADCFQLEEGEVANRYNIIENGDLNSGNSSVWINEGCDNGSDFTSVSDVNHPSALDNSVYKITGKSDCGLRKIRQHINLSGEKGDVFCLGAWAKAESVARGKFALEAVVNSPSQKQYATFNFNSDYTDWQYINELLITKDSYSSIDVYLIYENNVNAAYFDGVQLYKETYGTSYQYDSNGNIISSVDLANQNSKFEYNGENDLIKQTDPKGNNFKYEYDSHHNITKSTSSENVVNTFKYDQYGNPSATTIGSSDKGISSTEEYTYDGNYMKSLTDSLGNKTTYDYDINTGLLKSQGDAKGNITNNTYDSMGRLTNIYSKVGNSESKNSYVYDKDRISQIKHNGITYNFGYDGLGNKTSTSVGSQILSINEYKDRTDKLIKSTYGNGNTIRKDYDGQGRVVADKVDGDNSVTVTYKTYIKDNGWQSNVNNDEISGSNGNNQDVTAIGINLNNQLPEMRIKYQVYIKNYGWSQWNYDGSTAGFIAEQIVIYGKGDCPIEGIRIKLEGAPEGYRVRYSTYVQDVGWRDAVEDGDTSGIVGAGKKIDKIKINVDKVRYAYKYDANGNQAIKKDFVNNVTYKYTYDFANRLVKESDTNGNITEYNYDENNNSSCVKEKINGKTYKTNYSYDKDNRVTEVSKDGDTSYKVGFNYDELGRTTNRTIKEGNKSYTTSYEYLKGSKNNVGLSYKAYVADKGWQEEVKDGELAGTEGENRKMYALRINLTDKENLSGMRVKYQIYTSGFGWSRWHYDGEMAGIVGEQTQMYEDCNIKAIKIELEGAPEGYEIKYEAHVQDIGWQSEVKNGEVAGTTDDKKIEGIKISMVNPGASESTKVSSITNGNDKIEYTYDKNENIETITEDNKGIKYYYNEINELVREDNEVLNKTIVNNYDAGGNILSRIEYPYTTAEKLGQATKTYSYVYGDSSWKDKLTSFDGKEITYDQIGNPLTYDGWSFAWQQGRQLCTMSKGNDNISFKYNSAGIRTEKNVNGMVTKYILSADNVIHESNDNDEIHYSYDNAGKLMSINLNGTEYYYIRNVQNDIIGLINDDGDKVVSYVYDSWGKVISIDGELKDTLGIKNPYRYRGYRYDSETGLYYLNSRYYNPEMGRFINADGIIGETGKLLGHNMFAYCLNDPINSYDPSGEFAFVLPLIAPWFLQAGATIVGSAMALAVAAYSGRMIGNTIVRASNSSSSGRREYENAKRKGVPTKNHKTVKIKKGRKASSNPNKSGPYSSSDALNLEGVKQRRYYDEDGNRDLDIDFNHTNDDGTHVFPHSHKWDLSKAGKEQRAKGIPWEPK